MKYLLTTFTTIIAVGMFMTASPALAAPPVKVEICHFDLDYGVWKLISVSSNAVDQHFTHHDDGLPAGDTLGSSTALDEVCTPVPLLACPCWNTYTESKLIAALNDTEASGVGVCAVGVNLGLVVARALLWGDGYIDRLIRARDTTGRDLGDQQSSCSVLHASAYISGLTIEDSYAPICVAETEAVMSQITWCP